MFVKGLIIILLIIKFEEIRSSPLDDYVLNDDKYFNWSLIQTYNEPDYNLYILNVTSQKWLDENYSSRSIWWHYVCINVPKELKRPKTSFMLIDEGWNTDGIPKPEDEFVRYTSMVSLGVGSIAVNVQDVPNGPIRFMDDRTNTSRGNDASIGYTWKTFIENSSNINVPLNLPMTKAAYKAMDAVQLFLKEINVTVPETFILSGFSKRGWSTWLAGAVDNKRVIAIIPIVMDLLNMQKNLHHQYRSLSGWTFAFKDYFQYNITQFVDSDQMTKLTEIIDPLNYLDRYSNMKILQIQTTGDEFFLLDNEDAFWTDLQKATGGTHLRRLVNADHVCIGHMISIFFTIQTFYLSVYDNVPLPKMTWTKSSNNTHGYIRATVDLTLGPKPIQAIGYRARTLNHIRRDFRLLIGDPKNPGKPLANPVVWLTTPIVTEIETDKQLVYSLTIENPLSGWEGFLIQINFPGQSGTILELTTETQIIPDTYPSNDCYQTTCWGSLV